MNDINSATISTKSKLVSELNLENLTDFYNGLPYRYNSVTDLVSHENQIKETLIKKLKLKNKLFYRVFFLSNNESCIPILECLEIDGCLGGMLSTYLHDLDRDIIEGEGDLCLAPKSILIWQKLLDQSEFSFIFPSSHSHKSRTSLYMRKLGFNEKINGNFRCYFNNSDKSHIFLDLMIELIAAIQRKNSLYSFNHERIRLAKIQQAMLVRQWFSNF
ncbi:MAG: hypothetical protein AAGD25_37870 [Cyanobacteria bacterium P01_F01_bin.150]